MLELGSFRERLSEKSQQVLNRAIEESQKRQHYFLGVEHIFLAISETEKYFFDTIMRGLNLDPETVRATIKEQLGIHKQYIGGGMKIAPETKAVFQLAWEKVQHSGRNIITPVDIMTAIFLESRCYPAQLLLHFGIEPREVVEEIIQQARKREERERELRKKFELPPYLKQFGINLNKLAFMDKLPPIIGREREIEHVMEILLHKERSNSVMLIGEAGVGKTAIVEGLAQRIELTPEMVPPRLREKQIVNLQMNALVAGTMFRGMFEDRIEKIIKEVRERQNIILFIDEAHTIIGAGSAMGVPSDAANIFKSYLSRGDIQIIGATTPGEYKEFIAEDEAFARRFRIVQVNEPNINKARLILMGIKPRLEKNYNISITNEAIETSLELSLRYKRGLKLPDKAIGWLDTASVKSEIKNSNHGVTAEDVIKVVSEDTEIPEDLIKRESSERFKGLEETLTRRVVGQKEAISRLSNRLRLNKGPLKENFSRPDGILLFLGPTGVGKTELAKALAEALFGDENKMVRIDMSEYRDSAVSVDKLIGMPRGIVGSERGGVLTNQIKDNPHTVLLLDEIEKAHQFVISLFLQIFDEGWVTDGRGKKVYFSDTIIIMTSNLGADEFKKFTQPLGFLENSASDLESVKKGVIKEAERLFSTEFLNRIDDIIVFSPLSREEVKEIARMHLKRLRTRMKAESKELEVNEDALNFLVEHGYSMKYGARFLKRVIDDMVKIPITLNWNDGNYFRVCIEEGHIAIAREWRDLSTLVDIDGFETVLT